MASQSVARGESIAAFIPALERLIAEAIDEWKIPGLAVAVVAKRGGGSGWIDDDYLDGRLANLRRWEESRLREVLPER